MGKLGQTGGLMWRVTENWVMAEEQSRGGTVRLCFSRRSRGKEKHASWVGSSTEPRACHGRGILTGSPQSCQLGSRSQWICHCLMVSIKVLIRDLVLSITPAPHCHVWSPSFWMLAAGTSAALTSSPHLNIEKLLDEARTLSYMKRSMDEKACNGK